MALMPIAPGGLLHAVRGEVHVMAFDVGIADALMYPSRVYAVQMTEIDDLVGNTWDVLWDMYVPKDADTSEVAATIGIDASRDTADATPFEEPGEPSPNLLMGMREPTQLLCGSRKRTSRLLVHSRLNQLFDQR